MELYAENRSRLLAPISRNANATFVASSTASSGQDQHPEQASSAAPPDGSSLSNLTVTARGSQQSSQQLLQQISPRSVAGSASAGGGGGAAANVRHAAGAFAAAGPPQDLDATIMDRYGVLLARLTEAAVRIQRARRLGGLPRAARRLRRRQRVALAVQRVFRGHLGRRYAFLFRCRSLHTEMLRFQKTLASEVQFPLLWHPASGAAPLRLDPIARPLPLRIGYVILPDRSCLGAEAKVNADPRTACQKARPRRAP